MIVTASLGLVLSLSGCASPTEIVKTKVVKVLPPAGLIVPCFKPVLTGATPAATVEDVLKLKSALGQCAAQADEYLKWRKAIEEGG